ncbi:MAG: hypothetical protein L0Y60_16755 [Beijerinckiaceae bacterium]|nr:hypothetical protein [Beijerinckiaceae bacterium]
MSVQIKRRRDTATFLSTFTGAVGEILVDTTNRRLQVHDGVQAGGWAPSGGPVGLLTNATNGSKIEIGTVEESLSGLIGSTVASTIQIPNRAIVLAVSVQVTTAITGAGSFRVDATTAPGGGAGTTNGQFGSGIGVSSGTTNVGVIGPSAWYAASTITLIGRNSGDTANANFTGGAVRIAIQYLLPSAPTS